MTALIASLRLIAAASSCRCDQSAHSGWSDTTSRRTLVSTRINSALAPGEREDFLGAQPDRSGSANRGKAAARALAPGGASPLAQQHVPFRADLELDPAAGADAEMIAHPLRDGDLPFDRDLVRQGTSWVLPSRIMGILSELTHNGPGRARG